MMPVEIVQDFCRKWIDEKTIISSHREYFTENTIWDNVGLATSTGIEEMLELWKMFRSWGVFTIDVEMLHIAADGPAVLTNRIDHLFNDTGKKIASVRVMGVFEIDGGKIVRWQDFGDPGVVAAFQSQK